MADPREPLPAAPALRLPIAVLAVAALALAASPAGLAAIDAPAADPAVADPGAGLQADRGSQESGAALALSSPAFQEGERIPRRHTCDGGDRSPPLAWAEVPETTRSLALVVDDPDAPARSWVHWVYYDLPAELAGLPGSIPAKERPETGGVQGRNDFGTLGYAGPCPPRGPEHRYVFRLYALDTILELPAGATRAALLAAMDGHVLASGRLVGTYRRR